jgi:hypothetical protein
MIRFISFCTIAVEAANNAVIVPNIAVHVNTIELADNTEFKLNKKYIPAITRVAA